MAHRLIPPPHLRLRCPLPNASERDRWDARAVGGGIFRLNTNLKIWCQIPIWVIWGEILEFTAQIALTHNVMSHAFESGVFLAEELHQLTENAAALHIKHRWRFAAASFDSMLPGRLIVDRIRCGHHVLWVAHEHAWLQTCLESLWILWGDVHSPTAMRHMPLSAAAGVLSGGRSESSLWCRDHWTYQIYLPRAAMFFFG